MLNGQWKRIALWVKLDCALVVQVPKAASRGGLGSLIWTNPTKKQRWGGGGGEGSNIFYDLLTNFPRFKFYCIKNH